MRNNKIQDQVPEIGVRIPGTWSCPASLEKKLPPGYRITPGWLHMPDGDRLQVFPHAPDDEFAPTRMGFQESSSIKPISVVGATAPLKISPVSPDSIYMVPSASPQTVVAAFRATPLAVSIRMVPVASEPSINKRVVTGQFHQFS